MGSARRRTDIITYSLGSFSICRVVSSGWRLVNPLARIVARSCRCWLPAERSGTYTVSAMSSAIRVLGVNYGGRARRWTAGRV